MTCIFSFLDIPRFSVSLLEIISFTYFAWISDRNYIFFIGKAWSYVISFLTILCKKLNNVCLGIGSNHNSKLASSHFPLTAGYRLYNKYLLSLVHFSSVHQLFICFFSAGIFFVTLTVAMSCGANNSSHGYIGIKSQYPTTNFAWTITLLFFIRSSCLAFSCCGLMNFRFLPLLFLEYSWMWLAPKETGK